LGDLNVNDGKNIMDFKDMGYESVDWINLAQGWEKRKCCCEHGYETSDSMKGSEFLGHFSNY
jgi:hypothetical protein